MKEKEYTVLIAGSGNVTGMNINRALFDRCNINVLGCDFDIPNPSNLFCDNFKVPKCSSLEYPNAIDKIISKYNVTHVISSNDHDVRAIANLAKSNSAFPRVNGFCTNILNCLDKKKTEFLFKGAGVLTPELITDKNDFPYVLRKEQMGNKAKFVHIVLTKDDLAQIPTDDFENGIMTRFVRGKEYTIDVLCDNQSNLLSAIPRERILVIGGMVHHAQIIKDDELIQQCQLITKSVGLVGISCIQCIKTDENKYYFIEINPRPGSGIDLSINAGVNMPLLWLDVSLGKNVEVPEPCWNLQMKRYYCGYYY